MGNVTKFKTADRLLSERMEVLGGLMGASAAMKAYGKDTRVVDEEIMGLLNASQTIQTPAGQARVARAAEFLDNLMRGATKA